MLALIFFNDLIIFFLSIDDKIIDEYSIPSYLSCEFLNEIALKFSKDASSNKDPLSEITQ